MTVKWAPAKGPKTKRLADERMRQLMYYAACDDETGFIECAKREVPDAWLTLELDVEVVAPKDKMTLYLDKHIIKFFRAMGHGYQARINRILETYLQMKIAENVHFEVDMLQAIEEAGADRRRPEENPELEDRRKALHEHWAYAQGVLDASYASGEAA
ncbi:MAG: hypothetical protein HKM96_16055 [Boseongicola sp.]|nr:hypothetical protein [Boseongicola sp.]NNL73948.1 hypothetical protein [Silicimonas sp.]